MLETGKGFLVHLVNILAAFLEKICTTTYNWLGRKIVSVVIRYN